MNNYFCSLKERFGESYHAIRLCLSNNNSTGDVAYLHVFNRHALVINSYDAAVELLEKRSATFSSRPMSVMIHEL